MGLSRTSELRRPHDLELPDTMIDANVAAANVCGVAVVALFNAISKARATSQAEAEGKGAKGKKGGKRSCCGVVLEAVARHHV